MLAMLVLAAGTSVLTQQPSAMHPGVLRAAMAGRYSLHGVPLEMRVKYPAMGEACGNYSCREGFWSCFDGSVTLNVSSINDGHCDCADGSDEPSTAGCPNGSFYCLNLGHRNTTITSSLVGDGSCDCCDGSDEHARPASGCRNNCKVLAADEHASDPAHLAMIAPGAKRLQAVALAENHKRRAKLEEQEPR